MSSREQENDPRGIKKIARALEDMGAEELLKTVAFVRSMGKKWGEADMSSWLAGFARGYRDSQKCLGSTAAERYYEAVAQSRRAWRPLSENDGYILGHRAAHRVVPPHEVPMPSNMGRQFAISKARWVAALKLREGENWQQV